MKRKFLVLALIMSIVGFYSCEVENVTPDDGTEQGNDDQNSDDQNDDSEEEEEKVYLVTEMETRSNYGNSSTSFTYDDDNRVEQYTYTYGGSSTTTYDLEYDSEDRVTSMSKNGEPDEKFTYSGNTVTWEYIYSDEWISTDIEVNDDGKIVKRQSDGSNTYSTFEWENGNMVTETQHNEDGTSDVITISHDEDILNPAFDKYLGGHPMYESKNPVTVKDYGTDKIEFTVKGNADGYLIEKTQEGTLAKTTTYTYSD